MSQTLYIGGISYKSTNEDLQEYFSGAGTVVSANVIMDRATGRSRGFAFVEMSSPEEAQTAIDMFHGKEFMGRTITVNVARPKEEGGRGGRGGGFNRGGQGGYNQGGSY